MKFFFYIIKKILKSNNSLYHRTEKFPIRTGYIHDLITLDYIIYHGHEKNIIQFLQNLIFKKIKKNVAIDIGAHIGTYSVFFARFFSKIYSIEPNPISFELLKINCKLIKNVRFFNFFLSNKNGFAYLKTILIDSGHSLESIKKTEIKIKKKNINIFFKSIKNKIDFIKIDTEGTEGNLIFQISKRLKKDKPVILFESLDSEYFKGKKSTMNVLKSIGYKYFYIPIDGSSFAKKNAFIRVNIFFQYLCIKIKYLFNKRKIIQINKLKKNKNYPGIVASFKKF